MSSFRLLLWSSVKFDKLFPFHRLLNFLTDNVTEKSVAYLLGGIKLIPRYGLTDLEDSDDIALLVSNVQVARFLHKTLATEMT